MSVFEKCQKWSVKSIWNNKLYLNQNLECTLHLRLRSRLKFMFRDTCTYLKYKNNGCHLFLYPWPWKHRFRHHICDWIMYTFYYIQFQIFCSGYIEKYAFLVTTISYVFTAWIVLQNITFLFNNISLVMNGTRPSSWNIYPTL